MVGWLIAVAADIKVVVLTPVKTKAAPPSIRVLSAVGLRLRRINRSYPQTTIEQALTETVKLYAAIVDHKNPYPAAVRRALKTDPNFSEVSKKFLATKRNRSGKPLADITQKD